MRASLFLSPQEGGGCEPPSSLLEPVPVGGYCPYTPPLIPIIPFPHLACQNTDGWDWGQADGQSTCPTAAPPAPNGIWEERLYAQSPGHGTRRLLRVAGRFPPGVGGARPDFVCCFVVREGAIYSPTYLVCATQRLSEELLEAGASTGGPRQVRHQASARLGTERTCTPSRAAGRSLGPDGPVGAHRRLSQSGDTFATPSVWSKKMTW